MKPLSGPVLTAAEMRAAELACGVPLGELMERAGAAVAEAARRFAAGAPVLILCGPGNNGGDGYVAARILRANGIAVRVAASGDPKTDLAKAALAGWGGPVEALGEAAPSPIVVDGLFGTGLARSISDAIARPLSDLVRQARLSLAIDVPSGLDTDTGELRCNALYAVDLTLALGAVKPVHVLAESSVICGQVRVLDIGIPIPADADRWVIAKPFLPAPPPTSTKYQRGMVAIIGGAMPGASALAAEAALRAGAGYALLLADETPPGLPHAVVRRPWSSDALDDERIGAIIIGPGLGRDDVARSRLDAALATDKPVVVDGDALHLLDGRTFHDRGVATILTPHGGEFRALYGDWTGSKLDVAAAAADRLGAVVVFKGYDTVIADTNGRVIIAPNGSTWLSTAGTGDVLAGAIGALAVGEKAQVEAAVWMHGEAARRLGGAFIADDLLRELSKVRAAL